MNNGFVTEEEVGQRILTALKQVRLLFHYMQFLFTCIINKVFILVISVLNNLLYIEMITFVLISFILDCLNGQKELC